MMRSRGSLIHAGILLTLAAGSAGVAAGEPQVLAQDLVQVRSSNQVMAAMWTRRPDSYTLQLVLDRSRYGLAAAPVASGGANTASRVATSPSDDTASRPSFFIGNTIANLRGLDPAFGCRTLTLVDGRRSVPTSNAAAGAPPPAVAAVASPAVLRPPSVQVWLLRADGTQILPIGNSPPLPATTRCVPGRTISDEVLFRFPVADSAQAVAAAVRIGNDFYIEPLRPLESPPAAQ